MVSEIELFIVLTNITKYSARISDCNYIRRNIFGDHTSRAYDTIFADCNSWVYDSATSNPDTVLNCDRESIHLYCRPQFWINRMSGQYRS